MPLLAFALVALLAAIHARRRNRAHVPDGNAIAAQAGRIAPPGEVPGGGHG